MDLITTGVAVAVGKKLFGKTLDVISNDIAGLYQNGRDKIIEKATSKIENINDGRTTNLRVTRDVFWNGSFTDESICAEYFGGILASSRSEDGKDDSGVYFSDIIKSLSAKQIHLHYIIYTSLNKLLSTNSNKLGLNIGMETDLQKENLYLSIAELNEILENFDLGRELHALHAKSLIGQFQTNSFKLKNEQQIPYLKVSPKTLGVQLYAVAHNKQEEWRNFAKIEFGEFKDIEPIYYFGQNIQNLLDKAGIKDED